MGIFTRPESPYWWLYLETTRRKEKTQILVGETTAQKRMSRTAALERYHQRMLELAAGLYDLQSVPRTRRTMAEHLAWYRDNIAVLHRGAEREREIIKRFLVEFSGVDVGALTRGRVQEWMQRRLQDVAPRTVNRELDLLKSVMREAVPEHIRSSPIADLKRLRVQSSPHRRLLTPAEEARLLAVLSVEDRAIVTLGLDTLLRFNEITALRRADDHGDSLYIAAPKNGQAFEVPVSTRLRAALDLLEDRGEYFFPQYRNAKMFRDRRATFRKRFRQACAAADIPYGRKHDGITFHWATRRTGATRMLHAGVDVRTVQEIGNW
ncbi:MAG TPA: tyrosine-type recombinase/integrase, partial [Vicinamibacterales bacterium]|nr:tyrosine-type recombinase/integrase [Vicinamibacterales bacterium]